MITVEINDLVEKFRQRKIRDIGRRMGHYGHVLAIAIQFAQHNVRFDEVNATLGREMILLISWLHAHIWPNDLTGFG